MTTVYSSNIDWQLPYLSYPTVSVVPISAGRDWPLYDDEYQQFAEEG
ncbi:hypothetical protein [Methylobacter tundripaludum]